MKKLDLSTIPLNEYGHVQTRFACPVRLVCNDKAGEFPFVGIIKEDNDLEAVRSFQRDGTGTVATYSLVPVAKKVRVKGTLRSCRAVAGGKPVFRQGAFAADPTPCPNCNWVLVIDQEVDAP